MKRIFNEDSIIAPMGSHDTYLGRGSDMGSIWGYTGMLQVRNCPKWAKTVFFGLYISPKLLPLVNKQGLWGASPSSKVRSQNVPLMDTFMPQKSAKITSNLMILSKNWVYRPNMPSPLPGIDASWWKDILHSFPSRYRVISHNHGSIGVPLMVQNVKK